MVLVRIFFVVVLCSIIGCDNVKKQGPSYPKVSVNTEVNQNNLEAKENAIKQVWKKVPATHEKGFVPFYVYKDRGSQENHYIPSGFMGDWKCVVFKDQWQEDCRSEGTCIKIDYDLQCSRKKQKWAGVYWLNPANNWGNRKGGYNLIGAEKLVFWAKGEEGGEQIQEFKMGGIGANYPDSDTAVIGPIILSSVWKEYSIDLQGKDLSYISGGFSWSTSEDVNGDSCVFYLDDIHFE